MPSVPFPNSHTSTDLHCDSSSDGQQSESSSSSGGRRRGGGFSQQQQEQQLHYHQDHHWSSQRKPLLNDHIYPSTPVTSSTPSMNSTSIYMEKTEEPMIVAAENDEKHHLLFEAVNQASTSSIEVSHHPNSPLQNHNNSAGVTPSSPVPRWAQVLSAQSSPNTPSDPFIRQRTASGGRSFGRSTLRSLLALNRRAVLIVLLVMVLFLTTVKVSNGDNSEEVERTNDLSSSSLTPSAGQRITPMVPGSNEKGGFRPSDWIDKAKEKLSDLKDLTWGSVDGGASSSGMAYTKDGQGVYEALDLLDVLNFDTPQETMRANLKQGVRYLTAMAYGGHANQFISIVKALYLAKLTNRVAIIPTLIPIHIRDVGPEDITAFYDIPRFYYESEIPAITFSNLKAMDVNQSKPHNERVACWSVQEATVGHANLATWSFDTHDIWVDHWPLPNGMVRGLGGVDLAYEALKLFDFDQWWKQDWINRVKRESLPQNFIEKDAPPFKGDIKKNIKEGFDPHGTTPPEDQMFCVDNSLFLGPVMFKETFTKGSLPPIEPGAPGEGLSWIEAGQYIKFNPQVDKIVDQYLMELFKVQKINKVPPFITIHLRRGDFKEFAGFTALEKYTSALKRVQTALQARLEDPYSWRGPGRKHFRSFGIPATEYQVLTTTDEPSGSPFLEEVKALGWKVLDHEQLKTVERYGGWYPTILDGAILSRGQSFVGTDRSTFSHLAGLRVKYWRGGLVETAV